MLAFICLCDVYIKVNSGKKCGCSTLHGVRHTSISYLINRDVAVKKIADRAGHQNTMTTEEVYGHVSDKTKRATANEYDDLVKSWLARISKD